MTGTTLDRLRGAVLLLLPLGLAGCFLVPTMTVECSESRPCGAGKVCDLNTSICLDEPPPDMTGMQVEEPGPKECQGDCQGCTAHAGCPSLVCDLYKTTPMGGSCVATSDVVYVDNRDSVCTTGGDGSQAMPFCSLTEALLSASRDSKTTIRVMGSIVDYAPVELRSRTVNIFGPGDEGPRARIGGTDKTDAVSVSSGAVVTLDGLEIRKADIGVNCDGKDGDTRLKLRRMRIVNASKVGVYVSSCRLELDRSLLMNNDDGALEITGPREYYVTNSIFARHSPLGPVVKLGGSATKPNYSFRFNTVKDNTQRQAGVIDCGTRSIEIASSIVVENFTQNGSQFQAGCYIKNTVVWGDPAGKAAGTPPQYRLRPNFTTIGDIAYALKADDETNRSCCIDQIDQTNPKVSTDFFGTRRPQGSKSDVGAHEVTR